MLGRSSTNTYSRSNSPEILNLLILQLDCVTIMQVDLDQTDSSNNKSQDPITNRMVA